ncbi:Fungal Zn(2)-Cys(6) binuclear cluster domain-containing protein [Penicillium ucsense]|uniref:Fungal Zn(2)-Cys(6) binuclear cluster domain-containing protein n=1 Tax=Penicillium ucsense TaxID=2839758 RepID=A0A8J8W421_9EURO|nr:Fungal Zn(2)-Cys(6) binuclear cluster domain-containing protein [Penicillium ucsense]KAF7734576.1 Fungal Zn(2)-Cys(6) binuclear cluster domain-containing protein [Penicillium ucsense]
MASRSRRDLVRRPCDRCRQRKSRCVRDAGKDNCTSCELHHTECTFLNGPQPRTRTNGEVAEGLPRFSLNDLSPTPASSVESPRSHSRFDFANSLLNGTLGLDLYRYTEYIGPASYHEPALLNLKRPAVSTGGPARSCPRSVGQNIAFLTHPDDDTISQSQYWADLDQIENCIRPLGQSLVNLYFHIVHRTFPILDKSVFLEKYAQSYRNFSPPLLASVYLLALEWRFFDRQLANLTQVPDAGRLERLAMRTIDDARRRPKISTLQAGLLLLQRRDASSIDALPAQLISMGHTLGIHVDCEDWTIPEWEKSLRRRLAWALFVQDKWGTLVHGRPSLLPMEIDGDDETSDWVLRPCTLRDFPEARAEDDETGVVDGATGRDAFLQLIELSKIFSRITATFCSTGATRKGGLLDRIGASGALELAKPLALQLRAWHATLPPGLQLDSTPSLKLSTNGALHLSHAAAELTIHRALLRILTPDDSPSLIAAIRGAARARLASAVNLIAAFQLEHLQSFWGFAAASQVALVGSLAGLLWLTSGDADEQSDYLNHLERLRWNLQVWASAIPFAREALRKLDEEIGDLASVDLTVGPELEGTQ